MKRNAECSAVKVRNVRLYPLCILALAGFAFLIGFSDCSRASRRHDGVAGQITDGGVAGPLDLASATSPAAPTSCSILELTEDRPMLQLLTRFRDDPDAAAKFEQEFLQGVVNE